MTDEELKALVERNAQAIERNAQAIERNAQTIERNAQAIERLEEKSVSIDKQMESRQRQLDIVSEQIRALSDNQAISENRLTTSERHIQGIYDILRTYAREQAERSALIDKQIQALIDERRRA